MKKADSISLFLTGLESMADTYKTITCPACGQSMKKIFIPSVGVSIDICADGCGGIFFDNQEMQTITQKQGDISEIRDIINAGNFRPVDESRQRICSVCGKPMVKTPIKGIGIEIDTCYSCGGIFLDNGEYDAIRQGIKTKDINDVKSQNNINNINQNTTNGISDDFVRELYREGQAENRRLETMQGIASILNSRRRYGRRFDLFDLMWMIFR